MSQPPFAILHVCMGNICRSPMAERLTVVAAHGLVGPAMDEVLLIHSVGTGGWHAGEPMDRCAARQVVDRGGEVESFVARQLRPAHLDTSELILTATAEQQEYVLSMRPDCADRTFVLGEFGRLLRGLSGADLAQLPAFAPAPEAVYARGVALVALVARARNGKPPRVGDDLDDPWGRSDAYFARVADEIEQAVRPLAATLLS
jgi:protein-tyrosine phosphatase